MKTITFFSEKGGVGKSSFSIMLASWLYHQCGVSVAVADFNHRIKNYRNTEIRNRNEYIKKNPGTDIKPFELSKTWPIFEAFKQDVAEIRQDGTPYPYAAWLKTRIKEEHLEDTQVLVCDFPGSLDDGSFMDLISLNLIGLTVIPTEKDEMTLSSTLKLANSLKKFNKNYCCFINKAQVMMKNFRNGYLELGKRLTKHGVRMLPDIISYSERMMTIDKVDILRSTFGFLDFSKEEFKNINDLGLQNLFIDVTKELNKTADLPGTSATNLDFVNSLNKRDDGRSFRGSAFPEYEI